LLVQVDAQVVTTSWLSKLALQDV